MNWQKIISAAAIVAVTVAAGWVSYTHIYELTLRLGGDRGTAILMPFGVDGLITVGSLVLMQGGRLGWIALGPGVATSLFANVESGLQRGILSAIWSGIPALSFAIACLVLERHLRGKSKAKKTTRKTAEDAVSPAIAAKDTATSGERTPRTPKVAPVLSTTVHETAYAIYAELLDQGQLPALRAVKRDCHVGDDNARAIIEQLRKQMPLRTGSLAA